MLVPLPAVIDPHVHFRTPGHEYKEDWRSGARAAFRGGVSTVFDMPNTSPPCVTCARLEEKKKQIEAQLDLPLRYGLYLGADRDQLSEIERVSNHAVGIKVFMASSTGTLLLDDEVALDRVFCLAAEHHLLVAVHAEDELTLIAHQRESCDPADHSRMRPNVAAAIAVERAITKAKKYGTRLYILHMSTKEELSLVEQAKREGVDVACEVTPHHLFLTTDDYARFGTRVQMNPPLRSRGDCEALWEGVRRGLIDTIGTDHAPHTLEEKDLPFGKAPSGVPGVETVLPLLLDAVNKGKLSLERVIELTHTNVARLFCLGHNDDTVWVDMNEEWRVGDFQSKCGWSPFEGMVLKGRPKYLKAQGRFFNLQRVEEIPQSEVLAMELPPYISPKGSLVHAS